MDLQGRVKRLRAYEASPLVCAVDADQPAISFISPFGPMIGRSRLNAKLINALNTNVDIRLCCNISSELSLEEKMLGTISHCGESLIQILCGILKRYINQIEGQAPAYISFEKFWVVHQIAESYSPVHFHTGDISGILYLKTPEPDLDHEGEEESNYILARQKGFINFISGGKQRFNKSIISFRPVPGDLYLFPSWLLHGAEPFLGAGERRSMAFNANLATR